MTEKTRINLDELETVHKKIRYEEDEFFCEAWVEWPVSLMTIAKHGIHSKYEIDKAINFLADVLHKEDGSKFKVEKISIWPTHVIQFFTKALKLPEKIGDFLSGVSEVGSTN